MSEFIERFLDRTQRDIQRKISDEMFEKHFADMLEKNEITTKEILSLFFLAMKYVDDLEMFHNTPEYYMEGMKEFWNKIEKDIVFMKNSEHENLKVWINE